MAEDSLDATDRNSTVVHHRSAGVPESVKVEVSDTGLLTQPWHQSLAPFKRPLTLFSRLPACVGMPENTRYLLVPLGVPSGQDLEQVFGHGYLAWS